MPYMFRALCLLLVLIVLPVGTVRSSGSEQRAFPIAEHPDSPIEWWYANAHVRTKSGRHFALVCAFFRFGPDNGKPMMGMPTRPASHYLIYAVTDLDNKKSYAYSLADPAMVHGIRDVLKLTGVANARQDAMLKAALQDKVPSPHALMGDPVKIDSSPFSLSYGPGNSFLDTDGNADTFSLGLNRLDIPKPDDSDDPSTDEAASVVKSVAVDLMLTSIRPVMAVGGRGETGLVDPTDMYYFSRTRCKANGRLMIPGTADTLYVSGQAWIDHQWGTSWVIQNDGWDWWGIQLDNGKDILIFRQRDLATGKIFFPEATFMGAKGHQTVTHNIVFTPDRSSLWTSPHTGVRYPLSWTLSFPDQNEMDLHVRAKVSDQEIPILSPGGDI
jgi:predicted secreted hydrolase